MLLLRLWNYIRGYVIILVEGYFYEKFVNICTHRQIFLWDIKRYNRDNTLILKVSIKGFKLLRPIARKSGCRVKIKAKKGLPFILNRYRRRKSFLLGAVVFIVLIYVMTSFVWVVEITGNRDIETALIVEELARLGIKPGILKFGIDTEKAVNDIMLRINRLAWISITVKGTKVKVQIAERTIPPQLVPKEEPCNIVAAHDGVITSIIVKEGKEVVKVGDTVIKGQLLVSGTIPIKNEQEKARLVHAVASIKARTWYEASYPVSTVVTEKTKTGKTKNNYSIVVFNKRINLFHTPVKFKDYDTVQIKKTISILGEDLVIPFEIIINKYEETSFNKKEISLDEAKNISAKAAYEKVLKQIPKNAEIVKTDISFKEKDDKSLVALATIECIEEIGIEQKIGGN